MNLIDLLKQYADSPTDTQADFDNVARQVPPEVLGDGIAQAMRSPATPSFANLIGALFGGSDSRQRSGLLSELIRAAGPAALAGLGGGGLARLLTGRDDPQPGTVGHTPIELTPSDTDHLTPEQLQQIAASAEKADPGIIEKVSAFYARHPEAVKAVGGAVLAIVLGQIANRQSKR